MSEALCVLPEKVKDSELADDADDAICSFSCYRDSVNTAAENLDHLGEPFRL